MVARRLTRRRSRRGRDGRWVYTPLTEAMEEVGLQEVKAYVSFHHNTVAQFIADRTIIDLCLAAERRPGSQVANCWWEQERLDL